MWSKTGPIQVSAHALTWLFDTAASISRMATRSRPLRDAMHEDPLMLDVPHGPVDATTVEYICHPASATALGRC